MDDIMVPCIACRKESARILNGYCPQCILNKVYKREGMIK